MPRRFDFRRWFRKETVSPQGPPSLTDQTLQALDALAREFHTILDSGAPAGRFQGRQAGSGYEFFDYRPYILGEDSSRIHWKHAARTGEFLVVERVGELIPDIHIILDRSASLECPPGAHQAHRAALLGLGLAYFWIQVGARPTLQVLWDGQILDPPAGIPRSTGELLDITAEWILDLPSQGLADFGHLEAVAEARRSRPGAAFVISDFAGPPQSFSGRMEAFLSAALRLLLPETSPPNRDATGLDLLLDSGLELTCVRVISEPEESLPPGTRIVDSEFPDREVWIASSAENDARYRTLQKAHTQMLRDYCDGHSSLFLESPQGEGAETLLRHWLDARRERRT